MRVLGGLAVTLLLAGSLFAQNRGGGFVNPTPRMTGSFGNVVFPGGTAATGVQRSFGNVVFPGGGGPRLVVPGTITDPTFAIGLGNTVQGRNVLGRPDGRGRRSSTPVYAFPVYSYDPSYYAYPAAPQVQPQQPQNVVVVYPPQPAPVIINPYESGGAQSTGEQSSFRMYQAPYNQPAEEPAAAADAEATHYLLAFKDHTIYSAVAYWVEGDTLHYFTSGNKHNQASLSLVDRELTSRLNRESGTEVKLPK